MNIQCGIRYADARHLTLDELAKLDDGSSIIVLKNCLEAATLQSYIERILGDFGSSDLFYKQASHSCDVSTESAPLHKLWTEVLDRSSHACGVHVMDENIFHNHSLELEIMESLPNFLRHDYFVHFPDMLRPARLCLLLGGAGGRSDLHADPFAWTGWNYLLEGVKLWKFYPHIARNTDLAFQSWRVPYGIPDMPNAHLQPHQFCSIAGSWKSSVDIFAKTCGTSSSLTPIFSADTERHPSAQKATLPIEYMQSAGELLIFPGHCWHQVYHSCKTLGLAGQILNDANLRRVMAHIIDWCHLDTPLESFWSLPPRDIILQVISEAIDSM